jgi:hypothetical protein
LRNQRFWGWAVITVASGCRRRLLRREAAALEERY